MKKLLFFIFPLFAFSAHALTLSSDSISEDEMMISDQAAFDCGGQNISPDLRWDDVPSGTKSFALIMHDPLAKREDGFYHWIVADIPSDINDIAAGESFAPPARDIPGTSGIHGYYGACPPNSERHFYVFTIYALNVVDAGIPSDATPSDIEKIFESRAIASASITAVYQR
ncbi:MAG: YbhB/YbcL family Raf kinase inhibitor-like protein [Rickettsiales bacterium]|jgi:Raf kinase inhibitor-like YbhB/YbcL family protein|nr:YbhB/YbcL family Raf kinase inhibitor-like protein [Rickettsiales bacterium]